MTTDPARCRRCGRPLSNPTSVAYGNRPRLRPGPIPAGTRCRGEDPIPWACRVPSASHLAHHPTGAAPR